MAEVAQASGSGLRWFQLALYTDKELVLEMVRRAEQLGFKALLVTVDTPILGRRIASIRNQFSPPSGTSFANFKGTKVEGMISEGGSAFLQYTKKLPDSSQSWASLDWLRSCTKLPIILKGILTAVDAEEALKHDIQAIMVSNHGGRQLDGVPATVSHTVCNVFSVPCRLRVCDISPSRSMPWVRLCELCRGGWRCTWMEG